MHPRARRSAVALAVAVAWILAEVSTSVPSTATTPKAASALSQATASADDLAGRAVSLDEIRLMIDVTNKELRAATERHLQLDQDLAAATRASAELRAETEAVAQSTLANAISGYRQSEVPMGLMAAEDLVDSMRASTLGGVAVSADIQSFDIYRALLKDLEIVDLELSLMEEQVREAELRVSSLQGELANEVALLGELEERRLQNQAAVVSAQASVRGQYKGRRQGYYLDVCPVDGPHSFIDSWGFARSGGRRHKGVDILASTGTPIVAPVDGIVRHSTNRIGGRSFNLVTEEGIYFYGTHMSGFGADGRVQAGDVIGYVGDDGNAAGIPHLHFEIHPDGRGRPINPFVDSAAVCSGADY